MSEDLYSRTVSGFPLSISTALAFEALFPPRQKVYDETREAPPHINISAYTQMWINIETLFRNIMQSASKEAIKNTGYKEVVSVLIDEMDTITSLLNQEGGGTTTPVFYACNYKHALKDIHRAFTLRPQTTANQLHYQDLLEKTIRGLKDIRTDVKFFPGSIKVAERASVIMLSHIPYDLLSKRQFEKLDLLESNTGKLKKPQQWNTKYYPVPGKDMSILPFHRFLLLAFGDKSLIQPMFSKTRLQIMECAEKRNWTPMTTSDKCLLDLSLDLHGYEYGVIASAKTGIL